MSTNKTPARAKRAPNRTGGRKPAHNKQGNQQDMPVVPAAQEVSADAKPIAKGDKKILHIMESLFAAKAVMFLDVLLSHHKKQAQ